MKIKEENKYKLLVEGNDDQHVVWALCNHYEITQNFDVIDCESIDNVFKQLELRLKSSILNERIGIVVDADVNLQSRWNKVSSILLNNGGYTLPKTLPTDGLFITSTNNGTIIGVWIMPNNKLNGMLEDFLAFLATDGDLLMKEAEETLFGLETKKINRYKMIHRSKAKIHTYLAWQDEPGKPMGISITAKILNADSPFANNFITWLKKIYS